MPRPGASAVQSVLVNFSSSTHSPDGLEQMSYRKNQPDLQPSSPNPAQWETREFASAPCNIASKRQINREAHPEAKATAPANPTGPSRSPHPPYRRINANRSRVPMSISADPPIVRALRSPRCTRLATRSSRERTPSPRIGSSASIRAQNIGTRMSLTCKSAVCLIARRLTTRISANVSQLIPAPRGRISQDLKSNVAEKKIATGPPSINNARYALSGCIGLLSTFEAALYNSNKSFTSAMASAEHRRNGVPTEMQQIRAGSRRLFPGSKRRRWKASSIFQSVNEPGNEL